MTNPCNNSTYIVGAAGSAVAITATNLDVQLNNYPYYLSLGLACADIRPDFDANIAPGGAWTAGLYLTNGQSFSRPGIGDAVFTWPSSNDFTYTFSTPFQSNFGFSIQVDEIVINPDGISTATIPRGNLNVGWIVASEPACGTGDQAGWPVIHYSQIVDDQLSGSFPITIGSGVTVGVSIGINVYKGPAPYTGTRPKCQDAGYDVDFTDNISNQFIWPGDLPTPTMNPISYDAVTSFPNPDGLFCCATNNECCGAPPIGFAGGGKFLIPPPTTPTDVELNSSVPITDTPLYLANHTFQFVANYGRVQ